MTVQGANYRYVSFFKKKGRIIKQIFYPLSDSHYLRVECAKIGNFSYDLFAVVANFGTKCIKCFFVFGIFLVKQKFENVFLKRMRTRH